MSAVGEITVTIKAEDEVTPVLRKIRRELWWYRWGPYFFAVAFTALVVCAFLLGRATA